MKRFILYTLVGFTLSGCGGTEGRFRLKGEFEHLRQGEFYIYSNDGGLAGFDTIRIENGEFEYETDLKGRAVYHLLYPNLSEQDIFGTSGDVITVKGDARNLKGVEVEGSKPNEELTVFRKENRGKGIADTREAASSFMVQNPASPVSAFLFKEYFLLAEGASREEIKKHYQVLCKAQPDNLPLLAWRPDVECRVNRLGKGDSLPDFNLVLANGDTLKKADFKGTPLLINFWASWDSRSSSDMFFVKRFLRKNSGKTRALSISLDVDEAARKSIERRDSVSWPSFCDFKEWNSPIVRQLGIRSIPYYIYVSAEGDVLVSGPAFEKKVVPEIDRLLQASQ